MPAATQFASGARHTLEHTVMAEGNETPGNEPPEGGDLDFLAARRARRGEPRDPVPVRRAEVAEATVRTLETHMASLQTRLRELEEEQRRTAEQLGEREHEIRRVKQREYAEQQLRVEAEESRERLGREHRAEVDRLSRRLAAGERHARELADQLELTRRELAEAEQSAAAERAQVRRTQEQLVVREADLSRRELALDRTRAEVERRLGEARAFERQAHGLVTRAEQDSRQSYARLERIVGELKLTAVHLRDAVERERQPRTPAPVAAAVAGPPGPPPEEDAVRRAEMAEALAAAVERLRARVAAVGELQAEPPRADVINFKPRVLASAAVATPWLAPAIRRVAERRDAKLAGELIVELLPAQCLVVERSLTYRVKIAEVGQFEVRLRDGRASVERLEAGAAGVQGAAAKVDFVLEGPAAAFSELAAGGAGRRFPGLRVSGSRRRARRLLAARRAPLAVADLLSVDRQVWPGLLLLALAEAIDPRWTVGAAFVVAFAVESSPGVQTTLYAHVRSGDPIAVTRVRGEGSQTLVHLSERSFLRILAGLPLASEEQVLIEGEPGPLEQLIAWADRAQGRRRDA